MSGTRGGVGRILAMGVALALALLLGLAAEARAGMYAVAQCGWYVGADANWADTTAGAKFRGDGYCVPPAGADPFEGAHLTSLTRDGQGTVSGNRFARWRWMAPPGTTIRQLRGTWWHVLHDGIERRIGAINWAGGFEPVLGANAPDTPKREFVLGFPVPIAGFEDRLLCARAEDRWCSLDPGSWASLRALTITLEDERNPGGGIGGDLTAPGWRRGVATASIGGNDLGSGVRFGETLLDGARVALTEYPCEKVSLGGEWRATRMQPCLGTVSQAQSIQTVAFSDGPHSLVHCIVDFSGNSACSVPIVVRFDNGAPTSPRGVAIEGGEGWRRGNDFDLAWTNPDQGPASPIAGASWRLSSAAGHDSGVRFAGGRERVALKDLTVPAAGTYALSLWLRDEAGNEAPGSAVTVPLRFDDVPPVVAFAGEGTAIPSQLLVDVRDAHSGPAAGSILYRRIESQHWRELPTKLIARDAPGTAQLRAPTPDLDYGSYVFRADVEDAAGNTASSGRREDGSLMVLGRAAPAEVARQRTRLFARLRGGDGAGETLTVPFGAPATIGGRLTRADGAGVAARELRVLARPSRGALAPATAATVRTGARGRFELRLAAGPSRRISVLFPGDTRLEPSRRAPLELRVRSGVSLRVARTELTTGQTLRLSGRVRGRGATIPRRGKLVAIQYLEEATDRWRPVVVTRSDHDGSFHARYRFRYVSGRARVRLRATALAEERWPYAAGSSRAVTVDVRGR